VEDLLGVGVGQSGGHVADHPEAHAGGAARPRVVGEVPLRQVRGDHEVAVDPIGIPDRRDIGVGEAARDAGLVLERPSAVLPNQLRERHLERHVAFLDGVARPPDRRVGALADSPIQAVFPELRAFA
jgi:hypothetical protein